jgi:hypothetical protein
MTDVGGGSERPSSPSDPISTVDELRARLDLIVSGPATHAKAPAPRDVRRPFSSYVDEDLDRATALASRLMALSEAKGGVEGLRDAVDEAERAIGQEMPGLVPYAVKLFLTHYPEARKHLGHHRS